MEYLSEKLYITDEEVMEFADLLNKYERYAEKAAETGRIDKESYGIMQDSKHKNTINMGVGS